MKKYFTPITTLRLTQMAMMIAFVIVLGYLPSIQIGEARIGFGFMGTALTASIFGPVYGSLMTMIANLIKFFMKPTGDFFFGYTLTAGVAAMIYGFFLWRRKKTWWQILLAVTFVTFICNLGLNSLWVYMTSDKAFPAVFAGRVLKNTISLPSNTIALMILFDIENIKKIIKKYE